MSKPNVRNFLHNEVMPEVKNLLAENLRNSIERDAVLSKADYLLSRFTNTYRLLINRLAHEPDSIDAINFDKLINLSKKEYRELVKEIEKFNPANLKQ